MLIARAAQGGRQSLPSTPTTATHDPAAAGTLHAPGSGGGAVRASLGLAHYGMLRLFLLGPALPTGTHESHQTITKARSHHVGHFDGVIHRRPAGPGPPPARDGRVRQSPPPPAETGDPSRPPGAATAVGRPGPQAKGSPPSIPNRSFIGFSHFGVFHKMGN